MSAERDDPREPAAMRPSASIQRRTIIRSAMGGALVALLSSTGQAMAQGPSAPNNPFILLLQGIYSPVVKGPNLGLSGINLSDGSYSTTKIYPVFGLEVGAGEDAQQAHPIGNFFVQFSGSLCAYQLPMGAIAMQFLPGPGFTPHPDGQGGQFLEGTFELNILDANGIYAPFKGGHNHMVDRLHKLANGQFDEFCFCIISQYQFP
jgi:hypothetical protein